MSGEPSGDIFAALIKGVAPSGDAAAPSIGLNALAVKLDELGRPDMSNVESRRGYAARVLWALRDSVLPALDYGTAAPAHAALTELMLALHDIDTNGKTGSLFKPDPGKTRMGRAESAETQMRRGWIVLLVDYWRKHGGAVSNSEAFKRIARDLGVDGVSDRTIKSDYEKRGDAATRGPVIAGVRPILTAEQAIAGTSALRSLFRGSRTE